jgi:MinD superfamily P-loop ATPase
MAKENIEFFRGQLTISEPMPTPVIRQLKKLRQSSPDSIEIYDAPPGASCSVVETLRGMDFVLLVTEPTPFGLHDLKQIIGILKEMNIPSGMIINRDGIGDNTVETYCSIEKLPILLRIPFDRQIAEGVSAGRNLIDIFPEYTLLFRRVISQIKEV